MELREADPADAAAIRRVARRTWHEAYDRISGERAVEELIDEWYDPESLRESIRERPTFVAGGDRVVGFAQGGSSDDGPADASVDRIYVLPTRWGEGIGTALLHRLFDALLAGGHDAVWLAVLTDNEVGRSFYASHGFVVEEERTVELAGQAVEDMVLVRDL